MNTHGDEHAHAFSPDEDDRAETSRSLAPCPACGAEARREGARFCATCGKTFDEDGYLPADALRASYHFQRRRPPVATVPDAAHHAVAHAGGNRSATRSSRVAAAGRENSNMPLDKNLNGASTTALAFATYALVPYLGIIFCPGALLMGGIGLLRARRTPHVGGRRASTLSIVLGVVILCGQLFLWWILYKIPEWARPE